MVLTGQHSFILRVKAGVSTDHFTGWAGRCVAAAIKGPCHLYTHAASRNANAAGRARPRWAEPANLPLLVCTKPAEPIRAGGIRTPAIVHA